jgi:hypothetical protein
MIKGKSSPHASRIVQNLAMCRISSPLQQTVNRRAYSFFHAIIKGRVESWGQRKLGIVQKKYYAAAILVSFIKRCYITTVDIAFDQIRALVRNAQT